MKNGIPRTLTAALKRGFKAYQVDASILETLPDHKLIVFDTNGARAGSVSHVLNNGSVSQSGKVIEGPNGGLMICYHVPDASPRCVKAIRDATGQAIPDPNA